MSDKPLAAVFFDFAGTLFDDRELRGVHLRQLRSLADTCDLIIDDLELRAAYRQGMATAYGIVAEGEFYSHRDLFAAAFASTAEFLGGSLAPAQADELVDRQYAATVAAVALRTDCLEVLSALRAYGLHLQIVSNIDDEQIEALVRKFGLQDFLDEWTSSEEAQSCKPHNRIFELALNKAQCDPQSVLFVGDTVMHDITTPARLGMQTALLTDNFRDGGDGGGATHVIHALSDVTALLGL